MKMTIFTRILVATLLPVLFVLLIVIGTARGIIYTDGMAYAEEFVRLAARQISAQTAGKLESASALQHDVCKEMAGIDFDQPGAKRDADRLLTAFLLSNQDLYSTWFAFEPDVFPGSGRYCKTLLRTDAGIREISDLSDEVLDDPEASPWYNGPLSTGDAYADVSDSYDYGTGEGPIYVCAMTYPIITADDRIIGCMGLGIRYEELFSINSLGLTGEGLQRIMLVSTDGAVLYSSEEAGRDATLWDYGFKDPGAVSLALHEKAVWQEELEAPLSGETLLVCLHPVHIDHTGQTIYLSRDIPANSLYASFYSSMEVIIVTGILGIILVLFCVFFSTRGIAKHVKWITNSFNRVATDNAAGRTLQDVHIPTFQTNVVELDTLQSALISMMLQLRSVHELQLRTVETEVEKEKLVAASEAKTNFFAAMSHEIRTPMNTILGISEIMLHEGNLDPAQEKHIRDIKTSSDSLLNIINNILDLSKLETGKMEPCFEHYNFRAFLDNLTSLARHLAADANLPFFYEPEDALPLCLYGDEQHLRQVLLNLISNAVKFTREGYVALRVRLQGDTIRFDVIDTGIGIKEEEIGSVFEMFKQVDTKRNRKVKGTGLGLPISKSFVELMGGTIAVESVYGKGSTFRVTVPLVLGDEEKLHWAKPDEGVRYSDSLRVLIVDDDETNLSVSSGLFRVIYGIRCDTAGSGYEAIAKVQETDYDMIFMDHMMPELDGLDTTRHIRQLGGKYRELPIIALTANAVIGTQKELMDGGMDDFLAKPIQSGELHRILNTWAPREKRLPALAGDAAAKPVQEAAERKAEAFIDFPAKSLLEAAGIDALAGLENIGFDQGMYLKSLRLLRENLPHTIRSLETLLEQRNLREFHIRVHGLKGSLASVGANTLSEEAKRLEKAASEDHAEICRALWLPFTPKLWRVCEALNAAFPQGESRAGSEPFSEEQWINALQKLCSALERYDYEAVTIQLDAMGLVEYDPEKRNRISQMKRLIDNFDYSGAIRVIRNEIEPGSSGREPAGGIL